MATDNSKDTPATPFEQQAAAMAEQLGRIAGTIEGSAEQWLNRPAIAEQLTRVRDSASQLLDSLTAGAVRGREAATNAVSATSSAVSSMASATRTSGGASAKTSRKK